MFLKTFPNFAMSAIPLTFTGLDSVPEPSHVTVEVNKAVGRGANTPRQFACQEFKSMTGHRDPGRHDFQGPVLGSGIAVIMIYFLWFL